MCPCDLSRHHVCGYHERIIRDLWKDLTEAEANGWDSQRLLRKYLAAHGLAADVVKLKMDTEAAA
jgi:hypothetical protein